MTPELQAILDQMEPAHRKAFLDAVDRITSTAQLALLEDAIRAGDIRKAVAVLQMDATFFAPLDRAYSEAFYRGGAVILAGLGTFTDPFLLGVWLSVLMPDTRAPKPGPADTPPT